MKLVIYSDDEKARSPIVKSSIKYGFDLHVATGNYRWYKDLETRTKETLKVLESFDPEELVVVTDGHDVFVNNTADKFKEAYRKYYDGKIVFQSEHQNWPDPRLEKACLEKFTDPNGYSFLCFGMHVGTASQLVELYQKGLWIGHVDDELKQINPHLRWSFDDQLFSVVQYLQRDDIVIDGDCHLCQSMQGPALQSGDVAFTPDCIVNITKKTRPVFIHGHGNVQIKEIYDSVVKRYGY
jgi:hypothetical protein